MPAILVLLPTLLLSFPVCASVNMSEILHPPQVELMLLVQDVLGGLRNQRITQQKVILESSKSSSKRSARHLKQLPSLSLVVE